MMMIIPHKFEVSVGERRQLGACRMGDSMQLMDGDEPLVIGGVHFLTSACIKNTDNNDDDNNDDYNDDDYNDKPG